MAVYRAAERGQRGQIAPGTSNASRYGGLIK